MPSGWRRYARVSLALSTDVLIRVGNLLGTGQPICIIVFLRSSCPSWTIAGPICCTKICVVNLSACSKLAVTTSSCSKVHEHAAGALDGGLDPHRQPAPALGAIGLTSSAVKSVLVLYRTRSKGVIVSRMSCSQWVVQAHERAAGALDRDSPRGPLPSEEGTT